MLDGLDQEKGLIDGHSRTEFPVRTGGVDKHEVFIHTQAFMAMTENGIIKGLHNIPGIKIDHLVQVILFNALPGIAVAGAVAQER